MTLVHTKVELKDGDGSVKMVEREGRLRLWVKRGDLIVVYVIPDVVFFWR
jgi:hypothetical protein